MATSLPKRDRQSAPIMQSPSIQQMQSMVATVAELTRQNQELTREITLRRQCHERVMEGQAQSQEVREGENAKPENQSRRTAL